MGNSLGLGSGPQYVPINPIVPCAEGQTVQPYNNVVPNFGQPKAWGAAAINGIQRMFLLESVRDLGQNTFLQGVAGTYAPYDIGSAQLGLLPTALPLPVTNISP